MYNLRRGSPHGLFRICPGLHFAHDALFIMVASVLHAFNLSAPLSADGKPMPPKPEFRVEGALS